MILGIGADLVDTRRIEAALNRFGDRFRHRCFAAQEIARAENAADPALVYAKRFAAKEAVWKALGDDARDGIQWRELVVENARSGKPRFVLSGRAAERLATLTPQGMIARIDLSLSDEPPYAQAFVVVSAAPASIEALRPGEG
ncbi:holo-ACP synthase [Thalassobaculum sp. OXR-137]|uniref:holo-ACP synthase n=1 Tax=Thalassobaculum sp. OXR-137 TaxID=3100173 RepID=UPI002AC998C0|nr:holo-ACP synthase [Thalassobaculum sp. OXR-137]WPZ33033.1 holo-ACP synthase [Thalassobaculum sp. OXR-137]